MCGIAGSVNTKINYSTLELIKHRGPDYQSLIDEEINQNKVFFGHTRLSILDLSEAGNQPMYTNCGNYCIIFNGEVYNHLELRKKLPEVSFRGHSDTETILYYIKNFGIRSVTDFNGIFALAFLNKKEKKLYLARDHFGVKPLYYYFNDNKLVFSSELKVILASTAYDKQIDLESLDALLTFRYNPAPYTVFKNIFKLKAASYLVYDFEGHIEEKKYWSKPQRIKHNISKEDAIAEYQHLLQQSVKRQLLSDVPVGLLLSGGLDSAVLGLLMSKYNATPVKTFTVGFEGKGDFNETGYAKETARLMNSEHHEILINKKIYLDTYYKSFYHVEEPIAEPTISALNCVSKLASKHVKVVMSGQGIDEPLSGYNRYYGEYIFSKYRNLLRLIPVDLLSKAIPRNHTLSRGAHAVKYKNDIERFIGIYTIFTKDLKHELYNQRLQQQKDVSQHPLFLEALSNADSTGGSLSKLLYIDTRTMLPDNLLLFNDKITMANSIENRVPYLDIDLMNFIESLPVKFKRRGSIGKYLHREAVKEWIPKEIIYRKKRAFSTPVDQWFQDELSITLSDLINSTNSFSRIYFNLPVVEKMLSDHKGKKHNYKHELFMLLSLELWHTNFYSQF